MFQRRAMYFIADLSITFLGSVYEYGGEKGQRGNFRLWTKINKQALPQTFYPYPFQRIDVEDTNWVI